MSDDKLGRSDEETGGAVTKAERESESSFASRRMAHGLAIYLVVVTVLSVYILIAIFPRATTRPVPPPAPAGEKTVPRPDTSEPTIDLEFHDLTMFRHRVMSAPSAAQGLIILSLLSGILGSFMHAAQSLAMYVGNRQFTWSWAWWYILRPPIGGVLGLLFYFVVRAGLLTASAGAVSPYGVVAFGALAGWFSKQATDKLAELFENLFRTEKTREYRDKLSAAAPTITSVKVSAAPAPSLDAILIVEGTHFQVGAIATLGQLALVTNVVTPTSLTAVVPAAQRPAAGASAQLTVVNPGPGAPHSAPVTVTFGKAEGSTSA